MLFKAMGYFEISVGKIVLFLTALLLALLLNFALYFCIGISGLWLTEISRLFPEGKVEVKNTKKSKKCALKKMGKSKNFGLSFRKM